VVGGQTSDQFPSPASARPSISDIVPLPADERQRHIPPPPPAVCPGPRRHRLPS
jgi:hypothetical protein